MDQEYILGIAELDSQHETIERAIKGFKEAAEKEEIQDLPKLFAEVQEDLRFHFRVEESIMSILAYPEVYEHARSHLEVMRFFDTCRICSESDAKTSADSLMHLFLEQILSQDRRFAAFLRRNHDRLGL